MSLPTPETTAACQFLLQQGNLQITSKGIIRFKEEDAKRGYMRGEALPTYLRWKLRKPARGHGISPCFSLSAFRRVPYLFNRLNLPLPF